MVVRRHIDPAAPEREVLEEVADVFRRGGVVAYPTDTFYGLGADPTSATGVDAVFRAKGRTAREPLPLIAADRQGIEAALGPLPTIGARIANAFWPGPLTLVVPLGDARLAPALTAGLSSVAVRVPAHLVARAVARVAGGLVTATSANRSGEPAASTADEVELALGDTVELVLDAGPTPGALASTIVDVTGTHPKLVRTGRVPFDRVLESLR
jgi:L-threonylcarbamoyladenylate synthase